MRYILRRVRNMLLTGPLMVKKKEKLGILRRRNKERIYLDLRDGRAREIKRKGGIIHPPVLWMWSILKDVIKPDLCLDIGANYGTVSLYHNYQDSILHLYEANPDLIKYLKKSVSSKKSRSNIHIHNVFVSNTVSSVKLKVSQEWSGISSGFLDIKDDYSVTVQSERIDNTVNEEYSKGLIKIDVEGGEIKGLEGCERLLQNLEQYAIIIEVDHLSKSNKEESRGIKNKLEKYGRILKFERGEYAKEWKRENSKLSNVIITNSQNIISSLLSIRRPIWV